MERSGNTLSPVIRNAWDGLPLQTLTRNSPLKATGAHISIIGHITQDELRARLKRTDMANGFANRFLFCLVKRSRLLPYGGHVDAAALARLEEQFKQAVEFAKGVGRVHMTDAAAKVWAEVYAELSADRPGLLGAVTARAEAQVIRLSLIFALLDSKDQIDTVHLEAAIAVWGYCDQSANLIFGDSLGDPVADDILAALRRSAAGMTRTDISNLFGRNRTSEQIAGALALLLKLGRARYEDRQTAGRPIETWFATGGAR
jgi:DNA replicative helicase MCM subunit Mcm2 (Cdc46/Mcm family)